MEIDKSYFEQQNYNCEEVDEILGRPPSRLVLYGTSIILVIIILFLITSWFLKYPDTINGSCTLYAINTPKPVIARSNGRLTSLMVRDGELVKQNQPLVLINNTADYDEVLKLAEEMNTLLKYVQEDRWDKINISPIDHQEIGELQNVFQTFYMNYIQIHTLISKGQINMQKKILAKDILNNDSLKRILLNQKTIYEKDYSIAENDYHTKDILYQEKVIAKMELRQEESKLLAKKLPLENVNVSLINNKTLALAKQQELMELDKKYFEARSNFIQSINKLVSDIDTWKQKYVISSPSNGIVTFSTSVQEDQELVSGNVLFYVEPSHQTCFAQVLVDQNNFGKIALNQLAILRLSSYPFQEYGTLEGHVTNISRIPNEDKQYMVKLTLNKDLITNIGYPIRFTNELTAEATIITKQTRLLNKFLYAFKGIFNRAPSSINKNDSN